MHAPLNQHQTVDLQAQVHYEYALSWSLTMPCFPSQVSEGPRLMIQFLS